MSREIFTLSLLAQLAVGCHDPAVEVACPPGAARDSRKGDLCVCKEDGAQMVSFLKGMSYPACDPIDTRDFQGAWLPIEIFEDLGGGTRTPVDVIISDVFCSAEMSPRNFLERDRVSCISCDCASFGECIPAGCRSACGADKVCAPGSTCLADGTCAECGFAAGQVQCGGGPDGCGICRDGTMCVEGFCTALFRCKILPSKVCDVPDWCPVDVRQWMIGKPEPNAPCVCIYPEKGSVCQQFNGVIEFF